MILINLVHHLKVFRVVRDRRERRGLRATETEESPGRGKMVTWQPGPEEDELRHASFLLIHTTIV